MSSISILSRTLSCNETAELGFEPGAVGCEARTLSIVLCGILQIICIYLMLFLVIFFLFKFPFIFYEVSMFSFLWSEVSRQQETRDKAKACATSKQKSMKS